LINETEKSKLAKANKASTFLEDVKKAGSKKPKVSFRNTLKKKLKVNMDAGQIHEATIASAQQPKMIFLPSAKVTRQIINALNSLKHMSTQEMLF